MTRDVIAQALGLLEPLALALLGLAAASLLPVVRRRVKNELAADALQLLASLAATGVADAYQRVVADLKDPRQPGTWTEVAAAAVKSSVVAGVVRLGNGPLRQLGASGMGAAEQRQLVEQLVEAAVVRLKAELPAQRAEGAES